MTPPAAPLRRSPWSALGIALLCAHCSLSVLVAILAATGLLAAPIVFGVNWNYVWPPVALVGGFGLWLWSGREKRAHCELPQAE